MNTAGKLGAQPPRTPMATAPTDVPRPAHERSTQPSRHRASTVRWPHASELALSLAFAANLRLHTIVVVTRQACGRTSGGPEGAGRPLLPTLFHPDRRALCLVASESSVGPGRHSAQSVRRDLHPMPQNEAPTCSSGSARTRSRPRTRYSRQKVWDRRLPTLRRMSRRRM